MRACVPFTGSIPTQLCIGGQKTKFHTQQHSSYKPQSNTGADQRPTIYLMTYMAAVGTS